MTQDYFARLEQRAEAGHAFDRDPLALDVVFQRGVSEFVARHGPFDVVGVTHEDEHQWAISSDTGVRGVIMKPLAVTPAEGYPSVTVDHRRASALH